LSRAKSTPKEEGGGDNLQTQRKISNQIFVTHHIAASSSISLLNTFPLRASNILCIAQQSKKSTEQIFRTKLNQLKINNIFKAN
jgi:hypothetical protein